MLTMWFHIRDFQLLFFGLPDQKQIFIVQKVSCSGSWCIVHQDLCRKL